MEISKATHYIFIITTEAEYKAYLDATSEALWIQQILAHLGCSSSTSTLIYSDSQSAIALAKNPIIRGGRSKHIDVHFHFVRDYIADGRICLEYCSTKDNVADLLTKPLPRPTLDSHSSSHWHWSRPYGAEEEVLEGEGQRSYPMAHGPFLVLRLGERALKNGAFNFSLFLAPQATICLVLCAPTLS